MDKPLLMATLPEMREAILEGIREAVYEGVKKAMVEAKGGEARKRVTAQEVANMYNVGLMAVRNWEKKGLKRIEGRGSSALYYMDDVEEIAKQRYKRRKKKGKGKGNNANNNNADRGEE